MGSCVICREGMQKGEKVTGLPCGHLFHQECIGRCLDQSARCPVCRLDIAGALEEESCSASEEGNKRVCDVE